MHSLIVVNLYLIVFRKKIKVLGIFLKPGMVTYWISGFCFVTIYHVSIHELKGIKTAQTLGSLSFISFCVFCLYFNNFRGYVRKKYLYIREREQFLEIFKRQVDDIFYLGKQTWFLCLNPSPFLHLYAFLVWLIVTCDAIDSN